MPASASELERRTFDLGDTAGGRIAALIFGPSYRRPDTIFLHANGFNAMAYRTLLAPLAPTLTILAFDQRGHGRTTLPAEPVGRMDWLDLADDLIALLEHLGGLPVNLVGHSMGGTVSLLAAARRPDLVRALLLLDPVIVAADASREGHVELAAQALRRRQTFPSRNDAVTAYRGRGAFRTWSEQAVADYALDGFRNDPDGGVTLSCTRAWEASNYLAEAGHDSWGALAHLTCPTHVLRAETGSSCSLVQSLSPTVAVEIVKGTTHFLPFEVPEQVCNAIRQIQTMS